MSLKSELYEASGKLQFRPRKRWGQNFLIDENVRDKIISEINPQKIDSILEIGPGLGALTEKLIGSSGEVYAVEIDKKLAPYLTHKFSSNANFNLINNDILEIDFNSLKPKGKFILAGNLPYYISSAIIELIIKNRAKIKTAFITVQKEFAERIMAAPGTKEYGSLSLFVQYYLKPEYLFKIKRNSFYPAPEIESVFLKLDIPPHPAISVGDEKLFFKLIRASFEKRRKKLINSLPLDEMNIKKDEFVEVLKKLDINPETRGEDLGIADFAKIADKLR